MIEVRTPSRVHFGLLAYDPAGRRQFGGVGLMLRRPDVSIQLTPRDEPGFDGGGRMADRAVEFARCFAQRAVDAGLTARLPGAFIRVVRVPRPHAGLGSGTQLAMAVGRALATMCELDDLDAAGLAGLVGRGLRSAVGTHGCFSGGLIVDGGKGESSRVSPLVARLVFPESWRIVLVRPNELHGISGERERQAFAKLPPIEDGLTARMCQLVLLGLLPALVERDLDAFGESLFELQQRAGECFKAAQGGIYAAPLLAEIVQHVRDRGVRGVGQSSWGPTLYAIADGDEAAEDLAACLSSHFSLGRDEVVITRADNEGSCVKVLERLTR